MNILFIPTLPVKVEFTAMLRMPSNAKNAKLGPGGTEFLRMVGDDGDQNRFIELP